MGRKRSDEKRKEALRQILHRMRENVIMDIEEQIGRHLDEATSQKIDAAMDEGDVATLDLGEDVDYALLEMRYKTYKNIADAFRRLNAGTYGICESCGTDIPVKRLEVEPFARYCVPCLSRIEELEKVEREEDRFKD